MGRLAILVSVVAAAVINVACADTDAPSNSTNGIMTGPSVFGTATSDASAVSVLAAREGKGKRGETGGGSIAGPFGDGLTNFGDSVTFNVSTTATSYPWITVTCSQSGTEVYRQSNAVFLVNSAFKLGPTPSWQNGAADCTATLENWDQYSHNGRIGTLASLSFAVAP